MRERRKKREKKKRYERREGETEKAERRTKKKIAEEMDEEKSEGREGEKRIASSRPQQRTQHPWPLVLSHARIRFAPSEFQGRTLNSSLSEVFANKEINVSYRQIIVFSFSFLILKIIHN